MTKIANKEALEALHETLQAQSQEGKKLISLCAGSGCGAYGTAKVHEALKEELEKQGLADDVVVKLTGCHGFCEKGPIMVILIRKRMFHILRSQAGGCSRNRREHP